jgi:sugar phosphate isomerase/epimerase
MKLGIGSYTYGWATGAYGFSDPSVAVLEQPMTAAQLVDKAVELEVDCVQIVFRPALHELPGGDLDSLRDHAKERQITLEIGTSGWDRELLKQYCEIASRLRARLVRTIMPGASVGLEEERPTIAELVPYYEDAGVVLALENHEDCSSEDLAAMIEEIGSPNLGICLDTVNSLGRGEGTREVVDLLLPYTKSLHVKDFTTKRRPSGMGFEVTGATAGQGRLDIRGLLERAREQEVEGGGPNTVGGPNTGGQQDMSVILEQWSDFAGSLAASVEDQERTAASGIEYLKKELGRT